MSTLKLSSGFNKVKLQDFFSLMEEKKIRPYPFNRGTGKTAVNTVKNVTENFNPNSLTSLTVGRLKNRPFLMILDGHSRLKGLQNLIENQKINKNYLLDVELKVFKAEEEEFQTYKDLNVQCAHTSANKLSDPNYLFGSIITSLASDLGLEPTDFPFKSSFRPQLANLIFTYSRNEVITYPEVFKNRRNVLKLINENKESKEFSISKNKYEDIKNSIDFYCQVIESIVDSCPQTKRGRSILTDDLKSILNSSPFFCFFVADHLSENKSFTKFKVKTIANRIYKNSGNISKLSKALTNGSEDDMLSVYFNLKKKLLKA